jgi:hypothetical protein
LQSSQSFAKTDSLFSLAAYFAWWGIDYLLLVVSQQQESQFCVARKLFPVSRKNTL